MDRKDKRWETDKGWRQTGLSEIEETSLKYYIDYMASTNHPLDTVDRGRSRMANMIVFN